MATFRARGLAVIAMLTTSVMAAPAPGTVEIAPRRAVGDPFSVVSCVVKPVPNTDYADYDVHIPRPYNGGSGCSDVLKFLSSTGIVNWSCLEDEAHTGTVLHFLAGNYAASNDKIVTGLQFAYPTIAFQAQGICRQHFQKRPSALCDVRSTDGDSLSLYEVRIESPFEGLARCQDVKATLKELLGEDGVSGFQCSEDRYLSGTALQFVAGNGHEDKIGVIAGLQFSYPAIPFAENFICLGDTRKVTRSTVQDEIETRLASLRDNSTISKRFENPYCKWDGLYYLSTNDITNGNGIFGAVEDFCAANHGAVKTITGHTKDYSISPDTSVLLSLSNFCEDVEIGEQKCIDNFWIAGNSCEDKKIYPEGVHMYGATYMTECAGYGVVPFHKDSRVQPPELFQCWAITCVPGAAGDEQCRNSSSRCANGCNSGGKCVA